MNNYLKNPYTQLPQKSFWKPAVCQSTPFAPSDFYKPKHAISKSTRIVTAGSCFAQHLTSDLMRRGFAIIKSDEKVYDNYLIADHGFSPFFYSGAYGNIYTLRQLSQLSREAAGTWFPRDYIWEREGCFVDALRPGVFRTGFQTREECSEARNEHINGIRKIFREMDLFIYTLGLTEAWLDISSGIVYPVAPGVIAGSYDTSKYKLYQSSYEDCMADFSSFHDSILEIRDGREFMIILTLSPIPITATATSDHVLVANSESKAILRTVASAIEKKFENVSYFPAYEIVTNPRFHSASFEANLRSVRDDVINIVTRYFCDQHQIADNETDKKSHYYSPHCEEYLSELALDPPKENSFKPDHLIQILGNSFISIFREGLENEDDYESIHGFCEWIPSFWLVPKYEQLEWPWIDRDPNEIEWGGNFMEFDLKKDFVNNVTSVKQNLIREQLWIVGSLAMNRVGIMDHHPQQKAAVLDNNGKLVRGFRSNGIPIINCEDQCSSYFKHRLEFIYRKVQVHIERILCSGNIKVLKLIEGPMMSEKCGRYWMGDEYVESNSQAIYNRVINRIMRSVLGNYIDSGIILLVPDEYYMASGFTSDRYSECRDSDDMHCGPLIYKPIVKQFLSLNL